jgi:hypothetical protein
MSEGNDAQIPNENITRSAAELSRTLVAELTAGRPTYLRVQSEHPIDDVTQNVDGLGDILGWHRKLRIDRLLCLGVSSGPQEQDLLWAPVDISSLIGYGPHGPYFGPRYSGIFRRNVLRMMGKRGYLDFLEEAVRSKRHRFAPVAIDAAMESVRNLLATFLSYRIWGTQTHRADNPPISGLPPAGAGARFAGSLRVRVTSRNHGMRIYWAPAFFITWTFFGYPSSPVTDYLAPGRYVFGGDGGPLPYFVSDPAAFNIPPTLNPVLQAI